MILLHAATTLTPTASFVPRSMTGCCDRDRIPGSAARRTMATERGPHRGVEVTASTTAAPPGTHTTTERVTKERHE